MMDVYTLPVSHVETAATTSSTDNNSKEQENETHDDEAQQAHASQVMDSSSLLLSQQPQSQQNSPSSITWTDAADMITFLDSAVAHAGATAVSAASEVEEAKRNARAASEVARRFLGSNNTHHHHHHNHSNNNNNNNNNTMSGYSAMTTLRIPAYSPRRGGLHPPHPLPPLSSSPRSPLSTSMSMNHHRSSNHPPMTTQNGSKNQYHRRADSGNSSSSIIVTDAAHDSSITASSLPTSSSPTTTWFYRSHTEEIMSLSMTLNRLKQQLEVEQKQHMETQSTLQQAHVRTQQLEAQMQQLLNEMESQREKLGGKVDALEQELVQVRNELAVAEDDANLALEIATENEQRREKAERRLVESQEETDKLRAHWTLLSHQALPRQSSTIQQQLLPPLPSASLSSDHHLVRFAESFPNHNEISMSGCAENDSHHSATTTTTTTTATTTIGTGLLPPQRRFLNRSLVATGRELLRRSCNISTQSKSENVKKTNENEEKDNNDDDEDLSSSIEVIMELRKRLHDRVQSMNNNNINNGEENTTISNAYHVDDNNTPLLGQHQPTWQQIQITASLLQASGRKLGLTGRWWKKQEDTDSSLSSLASNSVPLQPQQQLKRKMNKPHLMIMPDHNQAKSNQTVPISPTMALDTLTRHYCTSVEVLIDRQKKEIVELESLCALWEQTEGGDTAIRRGND